MAQFTATEKTLDVPYQMLNPATRNVNFWGRKDVLGEIDQVLLPSAPRSTDQLYTGPQMYAICGLGGVGKTEIAREYAFSRQDCFDAVFWIEADQDTQLAEGFAEIATKLGYMDSTDQDRVVSRNITLEWLGNPRVRPGSRRLSTSSSFSIDDADEASWLLVFNNADDLSLLDAFWPVTQKGSILVTSRDPLAMRGRGRSGCQLKPFDPDTAATLLRQLTFASESSDNKKASQELAVRLCGLPLAVTQISALINRWDMTLAEFLTYFNKQISIETVAGTKPTAMPDPIHYKHSLLTVWALGSLIPEALTLLQVISFLNPDSISESLLSASECFSLSLQSYARDADNFIKARSDLTKTSLVTRNREEGKLILHRLVQDVVRSQMKPSTINSTLAFGAQVILLAWPSSFLRFDHDTKTWEKSEELLPHILKLRDHFHNYLSMIESVDTKRDFAKLFLFAGWYLHERSDFDAAKPLFLAVLDLTSDPRLGMDEIRADVLFALAALCPQINAENDAAIRYAQEHLEIRLKVRDGTRFREDRLAMAYGELAHAQLMVGLYEDTIENAKIAIALTETSPAYIAGDDWPTFSYTHQAFALAALDRYDEALKLIDQNLGYWMAHSHENHPFQ